jgi:hypothetical protein
MVDAGSHERARDFAGFFTWVLGIWYLKCLDAASVELILQGFRDITRFLSPSTLIPLTSRQKSNERDLANFYH